MRSLLQAGSWSTWAHNTFRKIISSKLLIFSIVVETCLSFKHFDNDLSPYVVKPVHLLRILIRVLEKRTTMKKCADCLIFFSYSGG